MRFVKFVRCGQKQRLYLQIDKDLELISERERERGQWAVYYTSPESFKITLALTPFGTFDWSIHEVECSKVTEGVIL